MFPVATFNNTKSIGVGCHGCNTWGAMNKCQNCHFPENFRKILCHLIPTNMTKPAILKPFLGFEVCDWAWGACFNLFSLIPRCFYRDLVKWFARIKVSKKCSYETPYKFLPSSDRYRSIALRGEMSF